MGEVSGTVGENSCGHNVTCKIKAFADEHYPLQDHDGDRYSMGEFKRLRGSHWRGTDCDDKKDDVYPGRKVTAYESSVDHNCNGIFGGNSTAPSYEELFCADSQPRGLVMLGDSATAHFHIPPQWITADGWNVDQFVPVAMNELDFPMCSWGTGHVSPEECPFQTPVPGVSGVVSLYTQMRNRNRCNHNGTFSYEYDILCL
jgi:acyloxyacyl hydrolase